LNCDDYFCTRIEDALREAGVQVNTSCRVKSINGAKKVESVECEKGLLFKADVVILAIGVVPNNELARDAGLEIGERQGIKVDQYMRTSDPDIFAIGIFSPSATAPRSSVSSPESPSPPALPQ